jgi:hypothetical protein
MIALRLGRFAFGVCAALAALLGCSGSQGRDAGHGTASHLRAHHEPCESGDYCYNLADAAVIRAGKEARPYAEARDFLKAANYATIAGRYYRQMTHIGTEGDATNGMSAFSLAYRAYQRAAQYDPSLTAFSNGEQAKLDQMVTAYYGADAVASLRTWRAQSLSDKDTP